MAGRVDINAGGGENQGGYADDDVLFNDDMFLAAVANVEAQHLGRLSNVLSSNGSKIGGEEIDGPMDSNVSWKRNISWERQNNIPGGPSQIFRGETGFAAGHSEDDSRKRMRTDDDRRMNSLADSFGQTHDERLGSSRFSESQQHEGEYMAALRGSNSELWQSSGAGKGLPNAAPALPNIGGSSVSSRGGSSGSCYKCGMEGHWARDCAQGKAVSNPSQSVGRDIQPAPNFPERLCPCGAGACVVWTANTEKNKGRNFFKCPLRTDGQCAFFEWCDESGQTAPTGREYLQSSSQQPELQCKCGGGFCTVLTAKTEKNMGRQFYRCPLPESCSFFQWCDEGGVHSGATFSSTPTRAASYSGSVASPIHANGNCFKCGQEGHWSKDCPNQQPQYSSSFGGQSQSYRGAPEVRATGTCFKCGSQDHWANACPNAGAPAGYNVDRPTGSSAASISSCFKCGCTGHWANRCPGGQR